ncbi:unnamed protein product [Thlaspi arvense]|uniref:Uncharacterized protein n=1 Tax=Thlaspi arvense TaxID=13288 RepID=A0AAU9TB27_THLAR|nr:unnamed protein product [Thlaspi arvense]
MRTLWNNRVSPNVIYSMHHLRSDKSTLVVGGIDGVLRFLDQDTGKVFSRCIMNETSSVSNSAIDSYGVVRIRKAKRLSEDARIDLLPRTCRPPIRCLAVGMQKLEVEMFGAFLEFSAPKKYLSRRIAFRLTVEDQKS